MATDRFIAACPQGLHSAPLTRRGLLIRAAAASTAAALPALASASAPILPRPTPMWAVGTPGDYDWRSIAAPTEVAARRLWASDGIGSTCSGNDPDCECDVCERYRCSEAERRPDWDGKEPITGADWLRADMAIWCSRCDEETALVHGAHPIGDEAVCPDCMTLADWDVVDPARAAELREEAADV